MMFLNEEFSYEMFFKLKEAQSTFVACSIETWKAMKPSQIAKILWITFESSIWIMKNVKERKEKKRKEKLKENEKANLNSIKPSPVLFPWMYKFLNNFQCVIFSFIFSWQTE